MSATQQQTNSNDASSPGSQSVSSSEQLPLDQVFEVLKNKRRREVLKFLQNREGNVSLSDLAEHVAAIENDTTVRALSSSQRKRVYVGLYQCHLPKMDDMNIVDFDQDRGRIELAENADQLDVYLDPDTSSAYWHQYYASTSLVGTGLFALSYLGASSYGLTPTVVLIALLLAIFAVSALHYSVEHGHLDHLRSKVSPVSRSPVEQ